MTLFPSSVDMSLMFYLTRFDSEMHEDEDDLEEVAAPIGDQQVSNLRYVSKPFFESFITR